MSTERPYHFARCGNFQKNLCEVWFYTYFLMILYILFVCLCWGLTSQSTIFQSCRDGATASWVINQYFQGVKCLAQGHNTAAVGLKPPTSRSGVRHSTTEPPRSPDFIHVYSLRTGADNTLGTKFDVNRKALSLCQFVASFNKISLIYTHFSMIIHVHVI